MGNHLSVCVHLSEDIAPEGPIFIPIDWIMTPLYDRVRCIREDDHKRPVTGCLQRRVPSPLLIKRIRVVEEGSVRLDRLTRLLIDMTGAWRCSGVRAC